MDDYDNGYKIGWQDGYYFGKRSYPKLDNKDYLRGYKDGFLVGLYDKRNYRKKESSPVYMQV